MSGVTGDIKKLFNYKYKKRDDSLTDQYNRLFMTKVMLIAASLTGISWYSDEIKCLVPGLAGKAIGGFSGKACWINGFYVYDELRNMEGCEGYFGMPTNTVHNGTLATTGGCNTCIVQTDNPDCKPMQKKFYIQYQWYPFYLAFLALLYYAPYFLFHLANSDVKDLKGEIKKLEPDIDCIIKTYFNPKDVTSVKIQRRNIILNLIIKCAYVISNILVFVLCNNTLNGDFLTFGSKYLKWSENPERNNYVNKRGFVEAGDMLLPTFGFCDVLEEGLDIKHTLINEHKFLCEISQHVLYQYVLMALWFLIVIGIAVSVYGLVAQLLQYAVWEVSFGTGEAKQKIVFKQLTIRQGEYLMFIRKKNEMLYGNVLDKLYDNYVDSPKKVSNHPGFDHDNL